MNAFDLQHVRAGFHQEAFGSQAVFRVALNALSEPGVPLSVPDASELPRSGHPAAARLLLALLDADCTLWLSPRLRASDVPGWLSFHTGCRVVDAPAEAMFAWVGEGESLPALDCLAQGSDTYPDASATCVVEVASLSPAAESARAGDWRLRGPGIAGERALRVQGLPADFCAQWDRNHARFPRGVDLFLATPMQLAGLPRTTRIQAITEA